MSNHNPTPPTVLSDDLAWNGDLQPEYDLSTMNIVRGKHAARQRRPHTVTIYEDNGTATVQYFDAQGTQIREEKGTHKQTILTSSVEPTIVKLEPDVAALFPDDASVNEALRLMIRLMQPQNLTTPIGSP